MEQEQIIDLDVGRDPADRADGLSLRWIPTVLLVPVCLALFTGAVRTPAPALSQVGVIPSFSGALPDDSPPTLAAGLVVAEVQGEVFAHYPDGRPAWRTRPLPDPAGQTAIYQIGEWEDSILLTRITIGVVEDSPRQTDLVSAGLDPATGRVRWQVAGSPKRAGGLVVVTSEPWAGLTSPRVYRSLPDHLLWTAPTVRAVALEAATDTMLTLTDQGHFTEYELSTGTPRRTARLRLPHLASNEELTMRLFPDRLTLGATSSSRAGPASQPLSYDRATLQQAAPSPLDRYTGLAECGPVLCASSSESTHILDRGSLAELWRARTTDNPTWTESGLLLHAAEPRLVDARTGEVRVDASGWTPVSNLRRSSSAREVMPALMTLRIGRRTYVARLTPRSIQVLGTIPQGLNGCFHRGTLLACRAFSGRTEVWRLDPRR